MNGLVVTVQPEDMAVQYQVDGGINRFLSTSTTTMGGHLGI